MGAWQTVKGTFRMFFASTKEDWDAMDKKFYRLLFGGVGFVLMALFWFYFIRNIFPSPFGF